jgi:6-phosphogluconolactonase
MPSLRMFVGTYTRASSKGIYSLAIDTATGALGQPVLAAAAPNPTFLALSPDRKFLYAVCANATWCSSFRVSAETGALAPVQQDSAGTSPTPCHIMVDSTGTVALAANYHLALAAAIPLGADGAIGSPRVIAHEGSGVHPKRQATAHVHSAYFTPDGRFALVCDLGLDRIYTYGIDREKVLLAPGSPPFIATAPASGPRHLAFGREGRHVYAINELGNTIVVYDFTAANGGLLPRQTVSILPGGFAGESTAAEVCVHPNGKFVYGSSRGSDTIAVFAVNAATGALSPVEIVDCGGKGPRSFALSPDGAWLVCAHQDSSTVCSFRVAASTGRLERVPGTVEVSAPVCVLFAG